jgi:hypothetical protein
MKRNCSAMKHNRSAMKYRWLKPPSQKWQRPDHKFATAAVALMIFLFLAGLANWLLSGNQGIAAAGASSAEVAAPR